MDRIPFSEVERQSRRDRVEGYEEGATFLKSKFFEEEIDFITRLSLTGLPPESSEKSLFPLEPVSEVLAKKLFI